MSNCDEYPRRHGLAVVAFLVAALVAVAAGAVVVLGPRSTPPGAMLPSPMDRARALHLDLPENPAAKRLLARVLCEHGRLAESKDLYSTFLSADAKDVDALRGLAQVIR